MTEGRNYRGFDPGGIANTEVDHFGIPPLRVLEMQARVHDAEIEIGEGPEPPARDGPLL
jgi:hypothetical protein